MKRTVTGLFLSVGALAFGASAAFAQPAPAKDDRWQPIQFLVGEWEGVSDGQPGKGTVKRSYRFVLGGNFLHEQNVSTYPAQPKNPKGEVHEHWSFFSYDRARQALILRQFHVEGFVIQYVMSPPSQPGQLVFETEALEGVPAGWKARETYEVVSPDEFVETFELARAGVNYEVYGKSRFKRVRRQ